MTFPLRKLLTFFVLPMALRAVVKTWHREAPTVGETAYASMRLGPGSISSPRQAGLKVGLLRLQMAWPFPDARIARVAERARVLLVPEINLGQLVREVDRAAHGAARVVALSHAGGHYPAADTLLAAIEEAAA